MGDTSWPTGVEVNVHVGFLPGLLARFARSVEAGGSASKLLMPAEESGAPDVDRAQPEGVDGRLIPTERLREDLKRVIDALGRAPTTAEYDDIQ